MTRSSRIVLFILALTFCVAVIATAVVFATPDSDGFPRTFHGITPLGTVVRPVVHSGGDGPRHRGGEGEGAAEKPVLVQHLRGAFKTLNPGPQPTQAAYKFKITFVMQDGIPLVALRVLSQDNLFVCVADTGSMELNLGGTSCTRCDKFYGSYAHSAALDAAPGQLLVYGTQKDLVKEVIDKVQLHVDGDVYEIPVCVTVKRSKAQSNYNVFGMQKESDAILHYMMQKKNSLLVRFEKPVGTIAGLSNKASAAFERNARVKVPLVKSDMGFFMTRVRGLRVGSTDVATSAKPIIWDTGSNMTSMPRNSFVACLPGLRRREPLTFLLDDGNEFTVESKHYVWHGSRELMLDDDLDVLGSKGSGYIIMGSYLMQTYQFLFSSSSLSIADVSQGPIELGM